MERARNNAPINNACRRPQPNSAPPPMINREGAVVVYMECRRNYAASFGGHLIDGCGRFVFKEAAAGQGVEQTSFLCATCGCHRSFHRKVLLPAPRTPPAPHLRVGCGTDCIMNYLRSLPLNRLQQPRPAAPRMMMMRRPTTPIPNYDLAEGQGSSVSPDGSEEKSDSENGDEINQPLKKIHKA